MASLRYTYGLLLRVYTPKTQEVKARVDRALEHVKQVSIVRQDFKSLNRLMLLVPRDYDCGETVSALRRRLKDEGFGARVSVFASHGHHSCEVLNEGLMELLGDVSHALIVSGKAMPYLTFAAMLAIDRAFVTGAKVAGLAVDELRSVVFSGRIQNTFAAWDIESLLQVGGFDSQGGVEEIAPLIRFARRYGKCIAPIEVGAGVLDVFATETARKRHEEVMATKLARQQAECDRLDADFKFIRDAVM